MLAAILRHYQKMIQCSVFSNYAFRLAIEDTTLYIPKFYTICRHQPVICFSSLIWFVVTSLMRYSVLRITFQYFSVKWNFTRFDFCSSFKCRSFTLLSLENLNRNNFTEDSFLSLILFNILTVRSSLLMSIFSIYAEAIPPVDTDIFEKDKLEEDVIRIEGMFSSLEVFKLELSEISCLKAVILYKPGAPMWYHVQYDFMLYSSSLRFERSSTFVHNSRRSRTSFVNVERIFKFISTRQPPTTKHVSFFMVSTWSQ